MAGKRILAVPIFLLVSALLFLSIGPGSGVKATNYDTTYQLILSSTVPGAVTDVQTVYQVGADASVRNVNFGSIYSATGYPEAKIVLDSDIVDGSSIGGAVNLTALSIFNGPCSSPITVTVPFMDCTTDTLKTAPWVGSGDNLVQDNDGDTNEDGSAAPQGTGNCIDGIDNDADTLKDGFDLDCLNAGDFQTNEDGKPVPPGSTSDCKDGIDNEGPPENPSCANAIDDDGDTNVNDGCPAKDVPEDDACVDALDDGEDDPADGMVNDGCPAKGAPEVLCANDIDDDGDTRVNDGCPAVDIPESPECANNIDDDGDTNINDGCPAKGAPEDDACVDALDDDADTKVNDGCPAKDAPEDAATQCADAIDDDADTRVNDGCPEVGDDLIDYPADPECDSSTDNNDLPTYCDHYPAYLNGMFNNTRPRARYMGHQVVVDNAPATMLDFVIFNPEALGGQPGVVGMLTDTYGFVDFVVLDNPVAPVSPSTITDFCIPLTSSPTLKGLTDGSITVTPGPEPYETSRTGQCNDALDNDSDGWVNDGCLVHNPAIGAGQQRSENPAAGTGLYGTNTHVVRTLSISQRDVDNDGVSNNMDGCPYQVNIGDTDGDGIDDICDPDINNASAGAPIACTATSGIPDYDQDCYPDRQDICPRTFDNQSDTDNPPGAAAADLGPGLDAIGDACDLSTTTSDGHYHVAMPHTYVCIGGTDTDGDGMCDATETLLGSDLNDNTSLPEYIGLDLQIATGTAAEAPGTCSDYTVYNHPNKPDSPVDGYDNDGDDPGDGSETNATDAGCAPIAGDADDDGVADGSDNCPYDKNQEQLDSDGDGFDPESPECVNDVDDDGDTNVNDGCPAKDVPEDDACVDALDDGEDDPADGMVNDGCPAKGAPEVLCANAIDDDGDTRVNDGCPAVDVPESPECVNDVDDDGDTNVNDGCPAKGLPEDPDCANDVDDDGDDGVNDGCPAKGAPEDLTTECDNNVDDDGDTRVNDGCPPLGGDECDDDDDGDGSSDVYETNIGTDPKDACVDGDHNTNEDGSAAGAPGTGNCNDGIDNDADTKIDAADAQCPSVGNDAWPLDFDQDGDADIVDVLKFKPVILKALQPGGHRFDFDADGDADIVDVLKFKPYILQSCWAFPGNT